MTKPKSGVGAEVGASVEARDVGEKPDITASDVAHAPIVFFESAPTCGTFAGIIRVTLCALRTLPTADGGVKNDVIVTGYLRCSVAGAVDLRNALDKALLLAAPTNGQSQ